MYSPVDHFIYQGAKAIQTNLASIGYVTFGSKHL